MKTIQPLSARDLFDLANEGKPIPTDRVIATFADPSNWIQLYDCKNVSGYETKACEWAFVGPVRPPYELAQHALKTLETLRK